MRYRRAGYGLAIAVALAGLFINVFATHRLSAQINPTEQQQTVDAAVQQLFNLTATALANPATQTAAFQQTINASFSQALTATALFQAAPSSTATLLPTATATPTSSPTLRPTATRTPRPTATRARPTRTPIPPTQLPPPQGSQIVSGLEIKQIAFAPNGGWVVLFGLNGFQAQGIPKTALDALYKLNADQMDIQRIAFTRDGGWAIIHSWNAYWYEGIPQEAADKIEELNGQGYGITDVVFAQTGNGWAVLYQYDSAITDAGGGWWNYLPKAMGDKLNNLYSGNYFVENVAFTRSNGWLIVYGIYGYESSGLPNDLLAELQKINELQMEIKAVSFSQTSQWAITWGWNGWFTSPDAPDALVNTLNQLIADPLDTAVITGSTPAEVGQSFLDWYAPTVEAALNNVSPWPMSGWYRTSPYFTAEFVRQLDEHYARYRNAPGGYDPFLCAQDVPSDIGITNERLLSDEAWYEVQSRFYGGDYYTAAYMYLSKVNGEWKISNIECIPPS